MSNLVEIAKDLEYVPDEQLIQLANGEDPRFPPFVVISEIKRRTDMRNRASEPMPRTTVAQEMVQEFAMPSRQGLEGMSQDATGILPPTVYNRDMPSSMMASGGSTNPKGYLFGGSVTAKGPIEPVYDEDGNLLEGIEALKASGKLRRFLNALMKEGGLTGYQTGNQTALTDTFIYGDNYANNLEDYLDMKRKTSTMDRREQSYLGQDNLKFPMLSTTPDFSMDMSGIGALALDQKDLNENVQSTLPFMPFGEPDRVVNEKSIANQQKRVNEAEQFLEDQLKIGDRGGLGGGSSYVDQARRRLATAKARLNAMLNRQDLNVQIAETQEKINAPVVEQIAKANDVLDGKIKIETDDSSKDGTTDTSKSNKFADMDLNIPERTQRPRTEAEMKQQLNADVLMTVGTAIGSSATPAELFQKLSGLPAQLASSRKEQRKEVRDFESDRRADALAKLNIQVALKKLDQAQEQARLKGNANDIAAVNALSDVLQNTTPGSARFNAAENALDSIIARLTGSNTQGIAALEKQFENIATLGG